MRRFILGVLWYPVNGRDSAPDLLGDLLDERKLCPLLRLGQLVADLAACKAALRAEAESVERQILCRLVDARDDAVLVLKQCAFGSHQTEDYLLVTADRGERLKAAAARVVKLKVVGVDVLAGEQSLRDAVVRAGVCVGAVEVAAADVSVDDEVVGLAGDGGVIQLKQLFNSPGSISTSST